MEEDMGDDPFMGMEHSFPGDYMGDNDERFRERRDYHKEDNMDGGSRDSPPRRTRRRFVEYAKKQVTRARKEGTKLQIGWNSRGQPINPNKSIFTYFVGYATKSTVPIINSDWGQVPVELKNQYGNKYGYGMFG
ncbi:hypothetical protein SESBI_01147 [Sesbania bispinosa]|nr:hypothetical protein SESBI_01147 [Sesbania bispinosa]